MTKTIGPAHMGSVRRWIPLTGNPRFIGLVACVVLFVGCEGGVQTPFARSVAGPSAPTASASAFVMPNDDLVTAQATPLSFAMNEVNGSGYSGTCTVGSARTGFRLKAEGQGTPETLIRFVLRQISTDARYTGFATVNQRGTFRTHWDGITFFPSGDSVECLLISTAGTILAGSMTFQIP